MKRVRNLHVGIGCGEISIVLVAEPRAWPITIAGHEAIYPPDLDNREFDQDRINTFRTSNITYLHCVLAVAYHCTIRVEYSGRVFGTPLMITCAMTSSSKRYAWRSSNEPATRAKSFCMPTVDLNSAPAT